MGCELQKELLRDNEEAAFLTQRDNLAIVPRATFKATLGTINTKKGNMEAEV